MLEIDGNRAYLMLIAKELEEIGKKVENLERELHYGNNEIRLENLAGREEMRREEDITRDIIESKVEEIIETAEDVEEKAEDAEEAAEDVEEKIDEVTEEATGEAFEEIFEEPEAPETVVINPEPIEEPKKPGFFF